MHPSLRGQIALAQAVLQGLRARRAFGWPADGPGPEIDPARCVERFGLDQTAWYELSLWGIMVNDLLAPVRYDPTLRRAQQAAFADAARRLQKGEPVGSLGLPNLGVPSPVPLLDPAPRAEEADRPGVDPIQHF
jgi:hypothetical protein